MCLAVPMKVIEIEDNLAKVVLGGIQRTVGLDIVDPKSKVEEYVIVHAGFAINVINEDEVQIILNDFKKRMVLMFEWYIRRWTVYRSLKKIPIKIWSLQKGLVLPIINIR